MGTRQMQASLSNIAFMLFDDDQTGLVSFKNIKRFLSEDMSDEGIQELVDEGDRDGDGELNMDEWKGLLNSNQDFRMKIFMMFDDDQTGQISFKNIKRIVQEAGGSFDDDAIQGALDDADRDGDGEISVDEFAMSFA